MRDHDKRFAEIDAAFERADRFNRRVIVTVMGFGAAFACASLGVVVWVAGSLLGKW